MLTYTLDFSSVLTIDDEQFEKICRNNRDVKFERTAQGELIIMPPVGCESGNREMDLMGALWQWNRRTKLGKVFSSSTCFKLPNGALRSPDAAWLKQERWDALSAAEKKRFALIAPDFVIELRSESDDLKPLQTKMQEYLENGVKLGWLIDPKTQQVTIYRPDHPPEIIAKPDVLTGEKLLPDFVCELAFLWSD